MIYMIGWDKDNNGPAGVMRELEVSAEKLRTSDIQFLSFDQCDSKKRFLLRLCKLVKENAGEVFVIHSGPYGLCFALLVLSKLFRKNKYYIVAHGVLKEESRYQYYSKSVLWMEKRVYKSFPNIICVSELEKRTIERDFGRTENVQVIENGFRKVNPAVISGERQAASAAIAGGRPAAPGELHIVTLGGIRKRKGTFETAELVKWLNGKMDTGIYLDIYGLINSEDKAEFERSTESISYIKYCGNIDSKEEMLKKLSAYDVHIALSHFDTFNNAVPDALSVGVPTIVSDMCGSAGLVTSGTNGLIVNVSAPDKEEILDYLNRLTADPEYMRENRACALKAVENYDWDKVLGRYLALK